jgi:hypothetical protein
MSNPSVILTRILGNALPPLHSRDQTLTNTRFILANESAWDNCQKTWILNRILDSEEKAALVDLLREHKQQFVDLPFEADVYRQIGFDYEHLPVPDFLSSQRAVTLSERDRKIAYCACLHEKNRYLMNNNGARNAALFAGRRKAHWCLPWDGNCYLTDDGYAALMEAFQRCEFEKYVIVPMHRCENNAAILEPGFDPCPLEEPQIAFRSDTTEEFDESCVYGFKSKVELLRRLGVPGKWDALPALYPWSDVYEPSGKESHQYLWGSYVLRLAADPSSVVLSYTARGETRETTIVEFIKEADYKFRYGDVNKGSLLLLNEQKLEMARRSTEADSHELRRVVLSEARNVLASVETDLVESDGGLAQRLQCQEKIVICALAFAISAESKYGECCAEIVRIWLAGISAAANGTEALHLHALSDAREPRATLLRAACDMQFLPLVLDAIKLVRNSPAWSEKDEILLGQAIHSLRRLLTDDPECLRAMISTDGTGVVYDLHSIALGAFVGDRDGLYGNLMRVVGRLTGFVRRHVSHLPHCADPDAFARLLASMQVWALLDLLVSRVMGEKLIEKQVTTRTGLSSMKDIFARLVQENKDRFQNAFQLELSQLQCYFECSCLGVKQKCQIHNKRLKPPSDLHAAIDQLVN